MGLSVLEKRFEYTPNYLDILYRCNMCGACDVSCKMNKDLENMPISPGTQNQRLWKTASSCRSICRCSTACVKKIIRMQGKKADRGNWAKGLDVKNITEEKAEVYFHAGCRYSLR